MTIGRRQFLQGCAALAGTGVATGLYSWQIEPRWVQTERLALPIRNLPPDLVGRTLVQLSDLHIGDRYNWRYQVGALQALQATKPDFVVYTGDFVSYETASQFNQLDELLQHAPLGTLGTAAILGNHDYGHDWRQPEVADTITRQLETSGMTVLRNDIHTVAGLDIVGLDDYWGTNYDPRLLMAVDPETPTILLCHNPDVVDELVWGDYAGWILAGHTHGGQVKPPFLPPPLLPVRNRRYTAGRFALDEGEDGRDGKAGGRTLYINRGLGNLWPVRFNVRPEITIFTLASA